MPLEFIDNFNKQLQIEQDKLKQRQLERKDSISKSANCLNCLDFTAKPVHIDEIAKIVTQQPEKRTWKEIVIPKLQQKTDSEATITEENLERPQTLKTVNWVSDIIPAIGVSWGF
ncbi:hypothetical protein HDV06_002702 [Boothiomyces sp. JEL0866]|nr:hypothetical protein HDV06_002702 [Boothiomyces sp. JEL0866]